MSKKRLSRTYLVALEIILLLVLYVLSYAPLVRFCEGPSPSRSDNYSRARGVYVLYEPVDLLIDLTPLRKPLFIWADLWRVGDSFKERHVIRMYNLDTLRAWCPTNGPPHSVTLMADPEWDG